MAEAVSLAEVEQFLYREARLLDERRFDEWMALYTDDGVYWVPTRHEQRSPDETVSLFYDDRGTMSARVKRFAHPDIHIQAPISRTSHIVSNVELDLEKAGGKGFSALAAFIMSEYRSGEPRWYSGRYEYLLRGTEDGLRIAMKKVVLVNCSASFTAMAVYL
jgi:benzoate/toluate 1,2-dioxygenase beta subunit